MVGLARRSTRLIVRVLIAPGLNLPFAVNRLTIAAAPHAGPNCTFLHQLSIPLSHNNDGFIPSHAYVTYSTRWR